LGLNRSTGAVLIAILLIGMGQELWAPFMPRFIEEQIKDWVRAGGGALGLTETTLVLLAVGVYGSWRDVQEAIAYSIGGRLGGALGTRRALMVFAALPLIGYTVILAWDSPAAPFVALPFITAYDQLSSPAALSVVGETLKERFRTMAIALQSIQRRIPRIVAYLSGGALVAALGAIGGVRAGVAISIPLVAVAIFVQWRHLAPAASPPTTVTGTGLSLVRRFPADLKKLLLADALARWAEGMPRELYLLHAVAAAAGAGTPGLGLFGIEQETFGRLLALQAFVSLVTYLPVGWATSRGGARRPFVALTFLFFASFPLCFWLLGARFGLVGLVLAYVVAGLRELGEPARKALITDLVPKEARAEAIGAYWSVRCLVVAAAPLVGALLWLHVGPAAPFLVAGAIGLVGALLFTLAFRIDG
jgi:hypothetical protein